MEFVLSFIMALCYIGLVVGFYILFRNERVYLFRIAMNHLVGDFLINYLNSFDSDDDYLKSKKEYNRLNDCVNYIRDKYTYQRMLFSFKPLRIEFWFTKDELSFLKEYKQFIPDEQTLKCEVKKALKK